MKFDPLSVTFAFWVLRVWLGLRAFLAGIEKFSTKLTVMEPLKDENGVADSSGAMVPVAHKTYGFSYYQAMSDSLKDKFAGEPLLPGFLTAPFYMFLGYILIALGLALLIGLRTRETLLCMGLLYCMLSVGLILISQDVSSLGMHVLLVAVALVLAPANRLSVDELIARFLQAKGSQ